MFNQTISRWTLRVLIIFPVAVFLACDAGRPAFAQTAVTWQLGRIQFQNKSGYPIHGLRIDDQQADSRGGYVRITALNDGECAPGAGVPAQNIQQRFLFRWAFDRDVSQLTFPQQINIHLTIEADGNVPCLDLNPFMQVDADQTRLDALGGGARYYWRPNALPPYWHFPGPRTVRVKTADAWPNLIFFWVQIWGFRGNRPLFLVVTYPYTLVAAQPPQIPADRWAQDIAARTRGDGRFGASIAGSAGALLNWAPAWQLRWLDFQFSGGRGVRVFHATSTANPAVRYTIYLDPRHGAVEKLGTGELTCLKSA